MTTRDRILSVAIDLLATSPDGDISTRAVCAAASISAPVLYRQFGDKEGLLAAVVDRGFDTYLATKRERHPGADPVQDIRDGWDSHVAFALANRNLYRLMNSPAMRTPPASAAESQQILTRELELAARQGKLRVSPALAAEMIMSANVGVALMLVSRPAMFRDPDLSRRVRDAVHTSVFIPEVMRPPHTHGTPGDRPPGASAESAPTAAARLGALLRRSPPTTLTSAETVLLDEWLGRVANAPDPGIDPVPVPDPAPGG
ncbi:TetR/AcrR family transcriptional regulator [Streptomyces sp. NBC_01190]|uniref:TetR/AcrR family transcriptional regulator n=1 Tax=Streptomyces sp. NBC_01190 TaxID=2903767 RepID=UPI003863E73A|nr:TetR/AcrR family transcriptional regulator [Streptomyces sp. NBC_01190]